MEDNPDDIYLTERALKKNNIASKLMVIRDGADALDYLFGCDSDALPTLMLLDLGLPKVNGLEVLARMRANERLRRLPVVILTSSLEEHDLFNGYDAGANSYIRKPVDFEQFSDVVRQLGLYWLVLNEQPPEQPRENN